MIERALIHVAGPAGGGKTTFVEAAIRAAIACPLICVRGVRQESLTDAIETTPEPHSELRRYRQVGAMAVALYRFPAQDFDRFFSSDIMVEYSEAVLIEGDCPLPSVDLTVFVTFPPPDGGCLLRRVTRDRTSEKKKQLREFERVFEDPEEIAGLFRGILGAPAVAAVLGKPEELESLRNTLRTGLEKERRRPDPAPTEHWAVAEGNEGIERADVVIVNVDSEHQCSPEFLQEIARLRKDPEVFRDVVAGQGTRRPITAVACDLRDPKDPGTKKALVRVRRTIRAIRRSQDSA